MEPDLHPSALGCEQRGSNGGWRSLPSVCGVSFRLRLPFDLSPVFRWSFILPTGRTETWPRYKRPRRSSDKEVGSEVVQTQGVAAGEAGARLCWGERSRWRFPGRPPLPAPPPRASGLPAAHLRRGGGAAGAPCTSGPPTWCRTRKPDAFARGLEGSILLATSHKLGINFAAKNIAIFSVSPAQEDNIKET